MKKIILTCLVIIFCIFLVIGVIKGCYAFFINILFEDLGSRDWHVPICGGYEIQKVNMNTIVLVYNPNSLCSVLVWDYINAYRYNTQYIQVWCAKDGPNDLLGIDSTEDKFYLIDIQTTGVNGPYSKDEFEKLFSQEASISFGEWVYTKPRPKDAVFGD